MPTESGKPAARRQILVRILKIKNWVRKWEAGTTASMKFTPVGLKLATTPSYHATNLHHAKKRKEKQNARSITASFITF
jgi:hypothetical protein